MKQLATCEICDLIIAPKNELLTTTHWIVTLGADQSNLGRTYVTLRKHKSSLSELSKPEWLEFTTIVHTLESVYLKVFGSGQPFNWACMMNNAFLVDPPSPHVHWHLRPRHNRSITINGIEFTDPEYGLHYNRNRKQVVDQATLSEIASMIKAVLVLAKLCLPQNFVHSLAKGELVDKLI